MLLITAKGISGYIIKTEKDVNRNKHKVLNSKYFCYSKWKPTHHCNTFHVLLMMHIRACAFTELPSSQEHVHRWKLNLRTEELFAASSYYLFFPKCAKYRSYRCDMYCCGHSTKPGRAQGASARCPQMVPTQGALRGAPSYRERGNPTAAPRIALKLLWASRFCSKAMLEAFMSRALYCFDSDPLNHS